MEEPALIALQPEGPYPPLDEFCELSSKLIATESFIEILKTLQLLEF